MQGKLLRVLDNGEYRRLGSETTHKCDVRVVAATNRDLAKMVQEGSFRQDLFYRIAGFKVVIPSLRERSTDIPAISQLILNHITKETGIVYQLTHDALEKLVTYDYPGNIRELRSVLIKASARSKHGVIQADDIKFEHLPGCTCTQAELPPPRSGAAIQQVATAAQNETATVLNRRRSSDQASSIVSETAQTYTRRNSDRAPVPEPETNHSLARNEELSIQKLLVQFGNRRIVADKLGISERTLYRKLKKYGLDVIAD
jgi:transcriptional regulator with PAS, ATPase and Fis domain